MGCVVVKLLVGEGRATEAAPRRPRHGGRATEAILTGH